MLTELIGLSSLKSVDSNSSYEVFKSDKIVSTIYPLNSLWAISYVNKEYEDSNSLFISWSKSIISPRNFSLR